MSGDPCPVGGQAVRELRGRVPAHGLADPQHGHRLAAASLAGQRLALGVRHGGAKSGASARSSAAVGAIARSEAAISSRLSSAGAA